MSISNEVLRQEIERRIPGSVDIERVTIRQFIERLAKEINAKDLYKKKRFIRETITKILDAMTDEEEDPTSEGVDDSDEEVETPKKRNPFNDPKELSKPLAEFLGKGDKLSRPETVKLLWAYIRKHDLQNPENRKEILLDDKMQKVFGVERFTMFKMAKYVSAHIHPFKPVEESDEEEKPSKKRKRTPKKSGGKSEKGKSKRQFPTYRVSPTLAKLCGRDALPRNEIVKELWAYIREHDLQNPNDKREIICDDLFRQIMGRDTVTMFSMSKHINPHILEKVDTSQNIVKKEEKVKFKNAVEEDDFIDEEEDDEHSDDDFDDDDDDDDDDESEYSS